MLDISCCTVSEVANPSLFNTCAAADEGANRSASLRESSAMVLTASLSIVHGDHSCSLPLYRKGMLAQGTQYWPVQRIDGRLP
jgi:hypothetical protein